MNHKNTICAVLLLSAPGALSAVTTAADDDLAANFAAPPASARSWVYWFWINGNISKEGITADLEAMNRVGVGIGPRPMTER